jgi:hypothetical protein
MNDTINDTIQALEQVQEAPSIDVSATKSTKVGDKVVASSIDDKPKRQRLTPKAFRQIGPAKWGQALNLFVNGELGTFQAVADHLGVNLHTVIRRAKAESWKDLRTRQVKRLLDMARTGDGVVVRKTEEELEELGKAQASVARLAISHASKMQDQADHVLTSILTVSDRVAMAKDETNTGELTRRLTALASVHAGLVETIRVLAGLPHPDKAQRQPRTKPVAAEVEPAHVAKVPSVMPE